MSQVLSTLNASRRLSRLAIASSAAVFGYWAYLVLRNRKSSANSKRRAQPTAVFANFKDNSSKLAESKQQRANIGKTVKQLQGILKTVVTYREVLLAAGMSVGLVLRTMLDLYQISNGTEIEKAIITGDTQGLADTILSFSVNMPLLAFVNNFIKYSGDKLSLSLRNKLSNVLYEKYMTDKTFYKLSQQNSQLKNVDQLLTADVDKFCLSIVELYNNLSKPLLDIIILVQRLSVSYTGIQTPAIMIAYLAFAGSILTQARKSLSYHIINETQCEGQLRYVHSRLIQNSEEICFYRGNKKELQNLQEALGHLHDALSGLILFKFKIGILDNIVGRYISTIVGYLAIALPFFSARYKNETNETKLGYYYVAGRMMVKLAESIQRMIVASNDLSKLAAYTQRVQTLLDSVDKVDVIHQQSADRNAQSESGEPGRGSVVICSDEAPMISLKNATISTPSGDILIKDVSLTIKQNQNVIITGPNGSGKSSIFRVLAGLWTVEQGQVVIPPADQLFYICQKPYMTLGTFRDQIIYPDTLDDMQLKGLKDDHLVGILEIVKLQYLLNREHTFDSISDWQDVLSGGEKQRMALARLFYHKPKFAILDECTSAVSVDVEQTIYEHLCSEITLLSVSHRVKQLQRFHQFQLKLDRDGSYSFKRLDETVLDSVQ